MWLQPGKSDEQKAQVSFRLSFFSSATEVSDRHKCAKYLWLYAGVQVGGSPAELSGAL